MTKKVSRRTPAPSRKVAKPVVKKKAATSTALALRPKAKPVLHTKKVELARAKKMDALFQEALAKNVLTDDTDIGTLGLTELQLTEKEEAILNEPVPEHKLRIKPTGEVYLSHPDYTRWFNRAFGRLGWTIAPRSKPQRSEQGVVQPYILYVHGKPVAFAVGEQDYFGKGAAGEGRTNKKQTWGDALESTVANALRRCAKRMGIGLEMWEPAYLEDFMRRECVQVYLQDGDQRKRVWRRRDQTPAYNEVGIAGQQQPPPRMTEQQHTEERRGYSTPPANDELPITDRPKDKNNPDSKAGQVQRLWVICKRSGRTNEEIKTWLKRRWGYASSKDIKRKDYDAVCKAIEAPGPLSGDDGRIREEPGEDD